MSRLDRLVLVLVKLAISWLAVSLVLSLVGTAPECHCSQLTYMFPITALTYLGLVAIALWIHWLFADPYD